jgi:hypothetical protein
MCYTLTRSEGSGNVLCMQCICTEEAWRWLAVGAGSERAVFPDPLQRSACVCRSGVKAQQYGVVQGCGDQMLVSVLSSWLAALYALKQQQAADACLCACAGVAGHWCSTCEAQPMLTGHQKSNGCSSVLRSNAMLQPPKDRAGAGWVEGCYTLCFFARV